MPNYEITDGQIDSLGYILNNLTVTGPAQGGLLNSAAVILQEVKTQKAKTRCIKGKEGEGNGSTDSTGDC